MDKNLKLKIVKYIYYILICVTGFILTYMYINNTQVAAGNNNYVTPVILKGFYQEMESCKWIQFNSYDDIITESKEITVRAETNEKIPQGTEIMFFAYRIDVKVLVNGAVVYKNEGSEIGQWDSFISPGINMDDQIRIIMKQPDEGIYKDSYKYLLNRMYYGTTYSLLKQQIKDNILSISIGGLILIVGIAILVTVGVFKFFKISEGKGYITCGFLLIFGGICTFINYEYITLICDHSSLLNTIDIVSEAFICEFLMLYLKNYLCTEKYIDKVNVMGRIWPISIILYFFFRAFNIMIEDDILKILLIVILTMFTIEIILLVKDYFQYKHQHIKYVLMSGMILLGATVAEIVHYYIENIYWIYVFQAGLFLFTFIQLGVLMRNTKENLIQAAKAEKLETELVQKNVAIMLSQIQPHFLYNSLTTIGYLCENQPRTARRLLNQFSDYLRVNMDSLKQNTPVPFSKELEHVKTYLELEKMRFDDDLNVEYDINASQFMIPALTVQPIVENAVKHGVGKKEDGGTVRLSVKEEKSDYVICVEDDGVGFDSNEKKDDNRTHVGIENVGKRLEAMSGGQLFIKSEKGVGTTAIIKIPKERTKEKYEDNSSR